MALDFDMALMVILNAREREQFEEQKAKIGDRKSGGRSISLAQVFAAMYNKIQDEKEDQGFIRI